MLVRLFRMRRRLRSGERGYSLVELLMVLIVLGVVCGALVTVFVSGTRTETNLNNRFRAQVHAATAISQLRRDVHCASAIAATSTTLTITLPSVCPTSGTVRWCVLGGGYPYALYRTTAATCTTSGARLADYLTSSSAFSYTAPTSSSLAKLAVDLQVNTRPSTSSTLYHLTETIVLRNTART
jgi:prepilin-type N-terminal cleavage/methylation domain-containing protein